MEFFAYLYSALKLCYTTYLCVCVCAKDSKGGLPSKTLQRQLEPQLTYHTAFTYYILHLQPPVAPHSKHSRDWCEPHTNLFVRHVQLSCRLRLVSLVVAASFVSNATAVVFKPKQASGARGSIVSLPSSSPFSFLLANGGKVFVTGNGL